MAKRKKRGPRHPGVVLIKPDEARRIGWRVRYVDPDSGKSVKFSLDPALSTLEQREHWATQKSRELARRRSELEAGAPRATGSALSAVIERYYDAHPHLRARTVTAYRGATTALLDWSQRAGVKSADELKRAHLLEFKKEVIAGRRHVRRRGGKRGEVVASAKPRSAYSMNRELRGVRTVLGYLQDLDLLPKLSHDDLRRALKRLPVASERIEFLRPHECQSLLEAALRHDAATFDATREEHRGVRQIGSTPRHAAIAPFAAFILLTGCRLAEALELDWNQVDLDALDHDGRRVGEIHLRGADTKTHKARTIGLEVSPALHTMLAAMHLSRGGRGYVFGLSRGVAEAAGKRLRHDYGAPQGFTWQALRRTCGTYLTNAPGIFGAASAYRSAKQLGHSVQIAEKHYLGLVRGIPRDARTLETAMQIQTLMVDVTTTARTGANPRTLTLVRSAANV